MMHAEQHHAGERDRSGPVAYAPSKRGQVLERVAVAATTVLAELDAGTPDARAFRDARRRLARSLDELRKTRPDIQPAPAEAATLRSVPDTDARGYKRASSTAPGFNAGRTPGNKGKKYPPSPPTAAEVFALIHACDDTPTGRRRAAWIALAYRTGLRVSETVDLYPEDLDAQKGSITVRKGKGGKRGIVGMDPWGWEQLRPWLEIRRGLPHGPIFCIIEGPTAGRRWNPHEIRRELQKLARSIGIEKRIACHQFRHAHAIELVREDQPAHVLMRQLRHSNLAITTTYLAGIDSSEVVKAVSSRPAPMMSAPDLMAVLNAATKVPEPRRAAREEVAHVA